MTGTPMRRSGPSAVVAREALWSERSLRAGALWMLRSNAAYQSDSAYDADIRPHLATQSDNAAEMVGGLRHLLTSPDIHLRSMSTRHIADMASQGDPSFPTRLQSVLPLLHEHFVKTDEVLELRHMSRLMATVAVTPDDILPHLLRLAQSRNCHVCFDAHAKLAEFAADETHARALVPYLAMLADWRRRERRTDIAEFLDWTLASIRWVTEWE